MVENMRPKQAALVLAQLKPGLAVKVIEVMDESKAGKALAVMPPVKAAELAEKLTRPINWPSQFLGEFCSFHWWHNGQSLTGFRLVHYFNDLHR